MPEQTVAIPAGYSYLATAAWFASGAIVTTVFSGSLSVLAINAPLTEVLLFGMLIPSFTWIVQLSASGVGLSQSQRRLYRGDLGRVCLLGSITLLPAAVLNLCGPPPLSWSAASVLASVAIMAVDLFRRSTGHAIGPGWPISWCFTIAVNMGLFVWSSWHWW